MSKSYPYQARAMMRFKAQDGQFVLGSNQLVTVTGQTDDEGDWLDVTDQDGRSGSVPAGFLIEIEPEHPHPAPLPSIPLSTSDDLQDRSPDPPKPTNDAAGPVKTPSQPHLTDIPASIERSPSDGRIAQKPISDASSIVPTPPPVGETSPKSSNDLVESLEPAAQPQTTKIPSSIEKPSSTDPISYKATSDASSNFPTTPPASKPNPLPARASHDPPNSQPLSTPSKAPPTPAAKPNALRDRIAMFNKPAPVASSPPPNTRPKPPIARKPMNIPPPAPPIEAAQDTQSSTPAPPQDERTRSTEPGGMSAADAEESVKAGGSLKDRIRLLQQQQQQQAMAAEQTPTAPKPKREWKRPPAAPADEPNPVVPIVPSAPQEIPSAAENISDLDSEAVPDSTEVDPIDAVEEDDEVARRRRIAERMAKLGGARMGFGFPGPAVPPKPSLPHHSSEGSSQAPDEPSKEEFSALPPERIIMPTIPKRAAPPRRKAPALSKSPSAVETPLDDQPKSINAPDDQSKPQPEDNLSKEEDDDGLRVVADSSALATEPSDNAAQLSDDNYHPPPMMGDAITQSQEDSTPDELSEEPVQDLEYVPIPSEKDPSDDHSTNEYPLHQQIDSSDEPTQAVRQSTIGSSSSIEPNLLPQLPHETHRSHEEPDHQLAPSDKSLGRSSFDNAMPSTEQKPHTSGVSSLGHAQEKHTIAPQVLNPPADPDEQSHDSIDTRTSSTRPPSPAKFNALEEEKHPQPPLPPTRSMSTSLANEAIGAGPLSPVLDSEVEPLLAAHKSDSLPPVAEPVSCLSTVPPPQSSILTSDTHRPDHDQDEGDALAPHALDTQPTRAPAIAEPISVDAVSATIPKADSTGEAINQGAVECTPTEDEDEEVCRRQRIAERLAKMGGRSMMGGASPRRPLPEPPVVQHTLTTEDESLDTMETRENPAEVVTEDNQTENVPVDNTEEEEDESARRRRIAERMAKMGGRPMMGGMVSMFPQQSPGGAASGPKSTSTANTAPSPAQPTRALPPAAHPQKSNSIDSNSVPSPPRRAAPVPTIPDPTDRPEESPPIPPNRPRIPSTSQVESEGAHSDRSPGTMSSHRPRIPNAYSSPKRSSIPSQSRLADEQLPNPAENHSEDLANVPYENAELLPATPPRRSIPKLPTAPLAVSVLGSSDQRVVPTEYMPEEPIEPESDPGVGQALDPEQIYRAPRGDLGSEETTEMGLPVPAHHQMDRMNSFKARDLDIASERWWRLRPVAPPSSVTSLDDVLIRLQGTSSLKKGITISQYELIVIRDDYSKTVVNVKFGDNPEDESSTELTQSHYPPPEPYEIGQLQTLSHSLGPQIVSRAKDKEDEKGFKGLDGFSFVKTIIQSLGNALEPVGSTFGQVIYHCNVIHDSKGSQPEIHIKDDIRPGDIVASYGASFKGKGIGHNSMNLGSSISPHTGVVSENDIKKNKFKAFGVFNGKVELMSYRLDELKSGSIVVYRVLDKAFLE
ncbi:hypothetical protein PGT21_003689 [Puccinia graminis f. sp. tritici]|uniref:SH3 domain-containing protein n=1 Tax=Puccinia graminis f. sp. tritici TaxID=56615 RepID=A0A5B0PWT5_PUCGR|nr:hypothetical protein PGTUg99_018880 [Puccinia graminis f. sp. tritici]KAA1105348.1 hypothetical protein PGT21_003689 [Puccinia graminis f. sp. tritici]